MANWSDLPADLIVLIAKRIELIEDLIAVRATCASWRSATIGVGASWPRLPLLWMACSRDDYQFFSLSWRKTWKRISLPQLRRRKYMESRGWLVTVGCWSDMSLLDPFSGAQIQLPPLEIIPSGVKFHKMDPYLTVDRAVISASPCDTSEYVVLVIRSCPNDMMLWRPRERSWTKINPVSSIHIDLGFFAPEFLDVTFYNGKLYAISNCGGVWECDILGTNQTEARQIIRLPPSMFKTGYALLAACAGELLVVISGDGFHKIKDGEGGRRYEVNEFLVAGLDVAQGTWRKVTSLGNWVVFVGNNGAFTIDASRIPAGVVKPNCIYFTRLITSLYHPRSYSHPMGICNLEDGKIDFFYNQRLLNNWTLFGSPSFSN